MASIAISAPKRFEILDEETRQRHSGADQNWYLTEWQRMAGCGPSVASNIVHYMRCDAEDVTGPTPKARLLALMEEVWRYVTPTSRGIPSAQLFCKLFSSYAEAKGFDLRCSAREFDPRQKDRPTLEEILLFLESALRADRPVAFLNLCNGEEANLDKWHWVTVIALHRDQTGRSAAVDILDEGRIKRIDLALWYRTTSVGGGFVSFDLSPREARRGGANLKAG